MRPLWSIRSRTALLFATTSMALTVAVLGFVNTAASWSLERSALAADRAVSPTPGHAEPDAGATASPAAQRPHDGTVTVEDQASGARLVAVAATLQWQWSAVGVVGAGILSGGLGWVVSRRMLRPIDLITDTTRRISASTLHERIDLDGPDDELRRLSRTIDELLDRLETAFASQRHFVAQASHELRTPLAVQRATLQIALHEGASDGEIASARAELLEQNRRTERLVESLLVLAEAERGLDGRTEPVDLAAVLAESVATVAALADRNRVRIDTTTADPLGTDAVVVRAEPVLLRQLVTNLVDNAVEYNECGGWVRASWHRGAGSVQLVVENTGPTLTPDTAGRLVEPFRRAAGRGSRQHSGLGLSIVAAIVRAHDWQYSIAARPAGGLRVTITMPDPARGHAD